MTWWWRKSCHPSVQVPKCLFTVHQTQWTNILVLKVLYYLALLGRLNFISHNNQCLTTPSTYYVLSQHHNLVHTVCSLRLMPFLSHSVKFLKSHPFFKTYLGTKPSLTPSCIIFQLCSHELVWSLGHKCVGKNHVLNLSCWRPCVLLQEFDDSRNQDFFTLYILNVMLLVNTWRDTFRIYEYLSCKRPVNVCLSNLFLITDPGMI